MPPAYLITSDTMTYRYLPGAYLQVLADTADTFILAQVAAGGHFVDTNKTVDYHIQTYWLRFRLINGLPGEVTIALPERAARVDLYTRLGNGGWTHALTGTLVSWSGRDGLKRLPAFVVSIPAGDTMTVYKRVCWNYVAAQPDSLSAYFAPAKKLIMADYVKDESTLMTSIQDAFILGLFILSMIISFYFFLVVREREFLYFSLYLLLVSLQAIPSLGDAFLRESPTLLLYLYIFGNSFMAFGLIHFLRRFLKTYKRFPGWDTGLVVFSFVQVIVLLASHFASAIFRVNLAAPSHFAFNLSNLISGVFVIFILLLYVRERDKATRLMIIALTPILCLKVLVYVLFVKYNLYSPGFGEPTLNGYVLPFNKAAFFILIICFLWMIGFFNWVLFLRFSNIRKEFVQRKELDQVKSRFFANISHEFRTPLTLLIGPLEDVMHGGEPEKLTTLVPEMHRNSRRLLQLINQLLDLSRLDSGDYRINTNREDIIPFAHQVVHSFTSLAKRKNISLKMEIDPILTALLREGNTRFYFDEDILEKVLSNLLSNAFKFTPEGGEIVVTLGLPEIRRDFLVLKVEDSGIGIGEDKLLHIFDRFYQADDSNEKRYGGSGIGLALLKELIDLLGGDIFVESEEGKGTVFYCYLPFDKKITAESPSKDSMPAINSGPDVIMETGHTATNHNGTAGNNILIVEDHEDVRKYIREKLADFNNVIEATNGREGLEIALKHIPDLVISDVMMPEMDGFELCRRLKTNGVTSHIPVILLTARAEDSDKMAGLSTGADAYLIKPFNSRELRVRVESLILIRKKMRTKFSDKLIVKPSEVATTPVDQQFMQKLLSVVEAHIGDSTFSVDQLAKEMNMSVSQLYRKLKGLINQSIQQFIRSVRMQRALELLKNDSGNVSEISWKVGFEDPGYFTKVFKKYFGCLPTERDKFPA